MYGAISEESIVKWTEQYSPFHGVCDGGKKTKPNDIESPLLDERRVAKVIGFVGSFAIFVNSIIGPGLLSLPKLFNDAGAFLPTVLLIFGFFLAALSTLARSETVALMPDNRNFIKNIEFCDPALKFVGRRTFYMSHCFFYLASMAIVIASIVLVSEALDIMLSKIFGRTFALSLNGGATTINFEVWSVNNCEQSKMCKPFVTGRQTRGNAFISLGYLLCFLTIFPISTTHLSQGLSLQYISLGVTLFTIPTMIIKSAYRAATNTSHLSFVVVGPDALSASGIVLFNLMYGIFVCTWLSEKRPDVSVKGVVYSSSFTACALMIGYGCAIAAASADIANDGLLENTEQGEPWPFLVCALSFGFFVIASGIPVACTMARRNLQHSAIRIVDDFTANAICVYFPWSIAWIFYTSPPYRALVNFSGLFIVSWLALWLPFFVLLHALHPKDDNVSYLSWYLNHLTACDHHLINDHVLQQQVDDGDNQPASFEQATDRRVQEGHTSDDDSMPQTVLSPLPTLWLQRRARPVYAILLFSYYLADFWLRCFVQP